MNADGILSAIGKLDVLVVGDICLDRWCWYDPAASEASRETGIPRIAVVRTEVTPGAGGTIANNLAALGVRRVDVLGVAGEDGFGWELVRSLNFRNIGAEFLVRTPEASTFTYTKLINGESGDEDRPRVDFINSSDLSAAVENQVLENLEHAFGKFEVVLVSDQAETESGGVVTSRIRRRICELAETHPEKVVWVDSRMRPELFRSVIMKLNEDEAVAACVRQFGEVDFRRLLIANAYRLLIVTHGSEGAEVIERDGIERIPARPVRAVDICGAGDSFSAGAACALSITGSPVEAAEFGTLVASITITKKGTGTASPAELRTAALESQR
jgi:rfaE bifunctional protein kinase chain/domain